MTDFASFFEVSAQLIPVSFLDGGGGETPTESEGTPRERVTRSWLFVSLIIGELLALSVVAGGLPSSKGVGGMAANDESFARFIADHYKSLDLALIRRIIDVVRLTYQFEYDAEELA